MIVCKSGPDPVSFFFLPFPSANYLQAVKDVYMRFVYHERMQCAVVCCRWRSHWLACCGTCTPIDCLSCCTAYFAPCVAYG